MVAMNLPAGIELLIKDELARQELELFDLRFSYQGGAPLIEIVLDKKHGGITLDECAMINKEFVRKIDDGRYWECNYSLAVSSPGMDWPLRESRDFMRVLGRVVRVGVVEPMEGKSDFIGLVRSVAQDAVEIEIKEVGKKEVLSEEHGPIIQVPLTNVRYARENI